MNYTACLPGSHIASRSTQADNSSHIHFSDLVSIGLASFAWMREMAQWADSEITGSGDAARRVNTLQILLKAAKSPLKCEFPRATHTFRISPCQLVLLSGLPRHISLKSLGLSEASQSRRGKNSVSGEASFFPLRLIFFSSLAAAAFGRAKERG